MRPDNALKALTIFEGKFMRLKEERENVAKAKEALELAEPGNSKKKVNTNIINKGIARFHQ